MEPAPRHHLLLELGRGGMGTVYLAVTRGPAGFSKLKVVKRLRADLASDPQFLQMFLDEARLAARLNHPNVVQTNEVGFDGHHYFIEMEYLEGQSLDALSRFAARGDGIPLALNVWALTQVLAGLHHAHEMVDHSGAPLNVVHRDVSPHNVLVTYDGNVKLLDFGIAKAADSASETRTGVVKGKATYMAPEQAARRPVDRRADVFAVGVMLWQALTGARLWQELSDVEIFLRLERGDIPSPRSLSADVPEVLDAICTTALAKDPDARYASAASFQAKLEAWLEESGTRFGSRPMGALVTKLFAEQRAAVRTEIDAQLREGATLGRSSVDIPLIGHSGAQAAKTNSGSLSASRSIPDVDAKSGGATASHTPRSRAKIATPTTPSRSGWRFGAAGVTLLALVGGAGLFRMRSSVESRGDNAPADGAAAARVRCTSNRQCSVGASTPGICRGDTGECATLTSEDCHVVADEATLASARTVWIGTMFPLSGPEADEFGRAQENAAELALKDFMSIAHGIPDAEASMPARPIGIVACDDAVASGRAARHLVKEVGIQAIVGFKDSDEVVDLSRSLFIPSGTLALASINMSPLIATIPHPDGAPRFVWRTTYSSANGMEAIGQIVPEVIEPKVRASKRGAVTRLVLLRPRSSMGLGMSDVAFSVLKFNGKSVLENGADFQEFVYPYPPGPSSRAEYDTIVSEVLKFEPSVVVSVGVNEVVRPLLEPLELRWPASSTPPYYIMAGVPEGDDLTRLLGKDVNRRRRVFGINPPSATASNVKFTMRYNDVYRERLIPENAPNSPYDAFYFAVFAAFAVGDKPLTGVNMARAMARLVPPGLAIDVGPARIFDAFAELKAGRNIDLNGATSALDFDLKTGEARMDINLICAAVDRDGVARGSIESGLRYDSRSRKLVGKVACP